MFIRECYDVISTMDMVYLVFGIGLGVIADSGTTATLTFKLIRHKRKTL